DKVECFVCGKSLPSSLLVDLSPKSGRPKTLAGRAAAAVSSVGPITARLGDRLIALILDTMFISAIVLVVAAALLSRWPHIAAGGGSATTPRELSYWRKRSSRLANASRSCFSGLPESRPQCGARGCCAPHGFNCRSRSDYAFAAIFVTFPPLRSPITQLP